MSAPEKRTPLYVIPENFIAESRILNGQIRVRRLADSLVLTGLLLLLAALPLRLLLPEGAPAGVRVTVLVMCGAPGFLAGQLGAAGGPLSVFLVHYLRWRRRRAVRLYNEKPRLLGSDPVKDLAGSGRGMDRLTDLVLRARRRRLEKQSSQKLVEGETFAFRYDPGIDRYLEDSGDWDRARPAGETELRVEPGLDLSALDGLNAGGVERSVTPRQRN